MTITNGYCTLEDVRTELNVGANSIDKDPRIEAAIAAASRQVDAHCGRRFWQDGSVVERQFYADDSRTCYVDDISTSTGLIVKVDDDDDGVFETTLTVGTNFLLLPLNAADMVPVWPYTVIRLVDSSGSSNFPRHGSGRPGVQVTAKYGWPAIPDDVAKACVIQSVQIYKAADAAFGAVQIGGDGLIHRLGATVNPIAAALLEPYCLPRVA